MLIALNFAGEPRRVTLDGFGDGRIELSTDADRAAGPVTPSTFELGPVEGVILRV